MSIYPQTLGIYCECKLGDVGTGTTHSTHKQMIYWFACRLDDDNYELQPLNSQHLPSGIKRIVTKSTFIKEYSPEHKYYEKHTLTALKSLKAKIDKGEELFNKGELHKAEQEFLKALSLDDQNARANLGLGAAYCENKNFKKLAKVIDILMGNDATFQEEQRHQFNTFAISLRKSGLIENALKFYHAALDLNPKDENLHFNFARALLERKDFESCLNHLDIAQKLNPSLAEVEKLRHYILKKIEEEQSQDILSVVE